MKVDVYIYEEQDYRGDAKIIVTLNDNNLCIECV